MESCLMLAEYFFWNQGKSDYNFRYIADMFAVQLSEINPKLNVY